MVLLKLLTLVTTRIALQLFTHLCEKLHHKSAVNKSFVIYEFRNTVHEECIIIWNEYPTFILPIRYFIYITNTRYHKLNLIN